MSPAIDPTMSHGVLGVLTGLLWELNRYSSTHTIGYSSAHTHQQMADARDVAGDRPDDVARVEQQLERARELHSVPGEYPSSTR
jgi:hypothetical protein